MQAPLRPLFPLTFAGKENRACETRSSWRRSVGEGRASVTLPTQGDLPLSPPGTMTLGSKGARRIEASLPQAVTSVHGGYLVLPFPGSLLIKIPG